MIILYGFCVSAISVGITKWLVSRAKDKEWARYLDAVNMAWDREVHHNG